MLYINDKLPVTQQDLQYFIGKWFQHSDDETIKQKERYHFTVKDDIISVTFSTTHYYEDGTTKSVSATGYDFVKIQQSFKEYPTYHLFYPNRQIVLDSEVFFMNNCKNLQKQLEGVK